MANERLTLAHVQDGYVFWLEEDGDFISTRTIDEIEGGVYSINRLVCQFWSDRLGHIRGFSCGFTCLVEPKLINEYIKARSVKRKSLAPVGKSNGCSYGLWIFCLPPFEGVDVDNRFLVFCGLICTDSVMGIADYASASWEAMKELKHPYYLVNILLSLSYPICKLIPPVCTFVFEGECQFEGRETEILFFMLLIVMARARKTGSMTMVAYLTNSFMYCKVANAALWFFAYKPYGLFFIVLFLLQGLVLPQPTYKGPQKITYFRDGKTFKDEITRDKKMTWLIEFYTAWNPSCVNFAPLFAELSNKYALENFKFGKIDLGRYPEIGTEFGISDSAFSKQLPTLILFQEGKSSLYRPFVDSAGKLIKFHFNKDNIINVFDLNNVHTECKKVTEDKAKNKKVGGNTNSHIKED